MISPKKKIPLVYLISSAFSGSTLLSVVINLHPKIVSVGEIKNKLSRQKVNPKEYLCSCGKIITKCPFWNRVISECGRNRINFKIEKRWPTDFRYKNKFLHKILSSNYPLFAIHKIQEILYNNLYFHRNKVKKINKANSVLIDSILKIKGKEILFDVSKGLSRFHYLSKNPNINLKLIWLVRDVRGVANSARKNDNMPVSKSANKWYKYQKTIHKYISRFNINNVLKLRYEDFCKNPEKTYNMILDFIGVRVMRLPKIIENKENHIIGNRMRLKKEIKIKSDNSWEKQLSDRELFILNNKIEKYKAGISEDFIF